MFAHCGSKEQQQIEFGRKLYFRALQACTINNTLLLTPFGPLLESFLSNSSSVSESHNHSHTAISDSDDEDDEPRHKDNGNKELDDILKIIENRDISLRWSLADTINDETAYDGEKTIL